MPANIKEPLVTLKLPPKTTAPYPGRGSYTVEFDSIIVSPVSKTISKIRGQVRAEANKYIKELAANSPIGHTKNLSRRWKVFTEVNSVGGGGQNAKEFEIYCRISNTAPSAFFRIVGRAPGRLPPIKPLKAWAKSKGLGEGMAYAIRAKIGKFGTLRYRTGNNMAGIIPGKNPNTTAYSSLYRQDNIVTRFLKRVEARAR